MIPESVEDRGIWPINSSKIVDKLGSQLVIPDLIAPDLRGPSSRTPSPLPSNPASSSVENTPPKSIEGLEKNHAKI